MSTPSYLSIPSSFDSSLRPDSVRGDCRRASIDAGPARLHVSLLLDASGSMEVSRKPAVAAVNRYLARLHDGPAAARTRLSLTVFNSHAIETVRDRTRADACPFLREAEYRPGGRTPLFDAVGYSAGLLDCLSDRSERRVLAILTDGLDTGSRGFTADRVRRVLQRNQHEHGWIVLYLGVDHDSLSQAGALGIPERWTADLSRSKLTAAADILADVSRQCQDWPVDAGTFAVGTAPAGSKTSGFTARDRAASVTTI
ncbi:MAG: vWA domain-containing protein [Hyphomicrobium aestuarii]|nr:vWA domain-containing protein [Hyphomicrobium aestuarii]